ncbi:MAG: hypothetical protein WAQ22_03780 [Candidatus Saccharimonas sp.]
MEATSIVALVIILGVAYWINSSREEKATAEATEKVIKTTRDELEQAREEAQEAIQARAKKFDIHFSSDELDWICDEIEAEAGREGLLQVTERYSQAGDRGDRLAVREQFESIKSSYQEYLQESELSRVQAEEQRKWQAVLDDFKRLNPAQQKSHLAYIKKHHAGELTNEQLHILELVSLGEANTPKSKDIEVGGVKLFTMREK